MPARTRNEFQVLTGAAALCAWACVLQARPTDPSGSGSASPNPVAQGGSTSICVSVIPGGSPASIGLAVQLGLAALGGAAAQTAYDDGTHGDVTAGDNIFCFSLAIDACAPPAIYSIGLHVSDAQGRSFSGSFPLSVTPPLCPSPCGTVTSAYYSVVGAANNTPWSWRLFSPAGAFYDIEDQNVPGVSSTTFAVAQAFAASINSAAANLGCSSPQLQAIATNGATVMLAIQAADAFNLYVGSAGSQAGCLVGSTLPACSFNPTIRRLPNSGHDCNHNGWDDAIDVGFQLSHDRNGNGIPDECECGTADFNNDGDVGTDGDIQAFFACLAGNCCPNCWSADFNHDGDIGTDLDIESFFRVLAGGPC